MFVPVPTPPPAADAGLRALRLSLNSPVISVESLPVGPAAAAIALYAGDDGPQVVIAVRREPGGDRLFYSYDDPRDPEPDVGLLLDAALSFAEGMGFLFDDDEVESRGAAGPREAERIWQEFAGLCEAAGAPEPAPRAPRALALTKFRWRLVDAASRAGGV